MANLVADVMALDVDGVNRVLGELVLALFVGANALHHGNVLLEVLVVEQLELHPEHECAGGKVDAPVQHHHVHGHAKAQQVALVGKVEGQADEQDHHHDEKRRAPMHGREAILLDLAKNRLVAHRIHHGAQADHSQEGKAPGVDRHPHGDQDGAHETIEATGNVLHDVGRRDAEERRLRRSVKEEKDQHIAEENRQREGDELGHKQDVDDCWPRKIRRHKGERLERRTQNRHHGDKRDHGTRRNDRAPDKALPLWQAAGKKPHGNSNLHGRENGADKVRDIRAEKPHQKLPPR